MAKDFDSQVLKRTGWESKPTKQALELLYMQGDLMITERRSFHKVYDLTENVLPDGIDTTIPSQDEYGRFLVLNYLTAHGIGSLTEMTYLLKGTKPLVQQALNELLELNKIEEFKVGSQQWFAVSDATQLLNSKLSRQKAHILSPFDNVLIQRKRISQLFDYHYQLECYVPANKRKYGYFCLPIVWDGQLIARADCRVDKPTKTLHVTHLYIEKTLKNDSAFEEDLAKELASFAKFNQCAGFKILKRSSVS
ncbi:hypothetical protein VSU01S_00410 [Vibrio superstes NBRC 103154]|uniref:Winged helix-turn-helix domain-containing protein n=2 Tax=Vibrio superstes TaxID=198815 RepID=A0A511QLB1_9VIBR|nr:hypothetical protein VSU01S_00410 [Vibrio superstes NBRC 103154]